MAKKVKKEQSVDVEDVYGSNVSSTDASLVGAGGVDTTDADTDANVGLVSQLAELEKHLLSAREGLVAASAENERLSDELGVSVAENKQLRKDLSKYKQDLKRVTAEKYANSELVDELNGQLVRKETQFNELKDTIQRLQVKVKEYASTIDALENENAQLKEDLSASLAESAVVHEAGFWKRLRYAFTGNLH